MYCSNYNTSTGFEGIIYFEELELHSLLWSKFGIQTYNHTNTHEGTILRNPSFVRIEGEVIRSDQFVQLLETQKSKTSSHQI